ncbi:hypothetical protein AGMMS49992_08330 [Clostridia bacterium]|nr:hypothetical protein AGMMS49992_08330 [Clostridia bacterium]
MELIYESARGKTVSLGTAGTDSTPFILTTAEGLYDLRSETYLADSARQAGSVWISSRVKRRLMTLEGFIARDVAVNRRHLIACFSPLEPGWLTLRRPEAGGIFERRIGCVVEQGPLFDKTDGSRFSAALVAPSPWWEDADGDSLANLTGWMGAVVFPWSMFAPFQFGGRQLDVTVNVFNPGDVRTGMAIRMYAADTVVQPEVIRPGTAEFLRITRTLEHGESFEIDTGIGQKRALYIHADGTSESGMRYLHPDSVFPQLEPGDNLLKASSVSGAEALTVSVAFRAKYLGV